MFAKLPTVTSLRWWHTNRFRFADVCLYRNQTFQVVGQMWYDSGVFVETALPVSYCSYA